MSHMPLERELVSKALNYPILYPFFFQENTDPQNDRWIEESVRLNDPTHCHEKARIFLGYAAELAAA